MSRIFVGIPAYNEKDLFESINNLVGAAKYPENLTVALFVQYDEKYFSATFNHDIANIRELLPQKDVVKYIVMKASINDPTGVCIARHNLFKEITDEEYFLSIDAHTVFKNGWDKILIDDLEELIQEKNNKNIIISSNNFMYKEGLLKNNALKREQISITINELTPIKERVLYGRFCAYLGSLESMMIKESGLVQTSRVDKYELLNYFVALFAFGPVRWIKEVGWSTDYKFYGEEPDISIRSFCYGWDTYSICYDTVIGSLPTSISGISKPASTVSNRNYNIDQIVKLFMTGKNNFVDLTNTKRTYQDYLRFHKFFDVVSSESPNENIDPNTLIDKYIYL